MTPARSLITLSGALRYCPPQRTILPARSLITLSGALRYCPPQRTILPACRQQARYVNTQGEELGGVQGSEPPSPKKNPVNWRAGTITGIGVGIACGWMLWAKTKDNKS